MNGCYDKDFPPKSSLEQETRLDDSLGMDWYRGKQVLGGLKNPVYLVISYAGLCRVIASLPVFPVKYFLVFVFVFFVCFEATASLSGVKHKPGWRF